MKRLLSLFLILMALVACLPAYAQAADENLVYNGDFSMLDSSGLPKGWQKEMWHTDTGVSHLYLSEEGYEGNCVAVVNADANDARFVQTIDVERDSIYRFSCMVKAEDCGADGYGATISFADCFSYSEEVLDTEGEWRRITVYGRTGKKQDEVTMMLRVGGYGNLGSGKAFFDNVEVYQVEEAPEGAEVLPLNTVDSSSNSSSTAADEGAPARNTEAWLLMACLYILLVLAIARRSGRIRSAKFNAQLALTLGLAAAFVLRMFISVAVRGYNTDINCFSAWSERMFSNGPGNFYAPDYFCDYPPGYMLLLWPAAALRYALGAGYQGAAHLLLIKFLPIACDILGAILVWRFARKHKLHTNIALALSLLYAFNPAAIIDSAAWGQIDSILALLIAICAIEAAEERYIPSLIAFAGAMLIKPQALLFAPLGLFAIVVYLIRSRSAKKLKEFAIGVACALGLLYLFALLFNGFEGGVFGPVGWLIELYSSTLGSYSYITVNALNLYQLLNLNWVSTDSAQAWTIFAWCLFAASYLYSGFICAAAKKKQHILLAGALLLSLIYCFGPKIHERYIFPAMLLLLLAYACDRDKRILASLTVMTAVAAMNEILVLQGGMTEANYGHLQSSEQWLNAMLSLINCLNALYLCWVAADVCVQGHVMRLRRNKDTEFEADYPSAADGGTSPDKGMQEIVPHAASSLDHRLHIRRIDCLLMAAVTLLYAGVAFFNLGSTTAPQTSWVSSQSGESITFDLGEIQTFRPIYYGGICNSNFTVELSGDGENWTVPCYAKYNQGEIFRWIYFVPHNDAGTVLKVPSEPSLDGTALSYASETESFPMQTARYFRITAKSAGLTLSEFGFWGEDGSLLPVTISSHSGAFDEYAVDAELLIDEQDCVAEVPSWYNSTYFDEIYHARTAYELRSGMSIYEWTHPPLGKVTMMLGIELFGMTPFGWRFMGALMGVMMVPLMYLMAKQLTKNVKLSFIAMCLMAMDSMHFTQTRIATIDSYAVFWIMLEYLFMFRYFQMDWSKNAFWKTLIPLGLCGVTMGVAIATKWIGVYAAVGLAVLFFWKLFAEGRQAAEKKIYWKRFVLTGCFCIGFFIIIPVLIYYFSHYLQLVHEGVASFKDMFSREWVERVIELQQQMLDYHAGLGGDTHYFRSPWYQWPVIWWPMWYYSGADYVAGDMVSSISCMGNPAVWWSGLIALIAILVGAAWKRKTPKAWLLVLIGFASQFLPWVLVPRSTFIYHYFASVPFIILSTVLALDWMKQHDRQTARWTSVVLVAAALVLFIAFYPLESGVTVPKAYAQYLRWFKWYNF